MNAYGTQLINEAIKANGVSYNQYGVGSFPITNEQAAQFTFNRNVCDGNIEGDAEGCFQVRKPNARRDGYIIFNYY